MAPSSFPLFSRLPKELQLKIWESSVCGPSMHVFDVCFPSKRRMERSRRAFADRVGVSPAEDITKTVFLDTLDDIPDANPRKAEVARHRHDPSVYRHRESLRRTTRDAFDSSRIRGPTNTVYLPGRSRKIEYNNTEDVLFLRFRGIETNTEVSSEVEVNILDNMPPYLEDVAEVLGGQWSAGMAATLQNAKMIALDVAETWAPASTGEYGLEEIAYLACCLQKELEVLYLVDHCVGRCTRCGRQDLDAGQLGSRGFLADDLCGDDQKEVQRPGDVINGIGKTYREVFDLEALGWNTFHPTYLFAKIISDTIRCQQRDAGSEVFKGVRILVVEETHLPGIDSSILVDCEPERTVNQTTPAVKEFEIAS